MVEFSDGLRWGECRVIVALFSSHPFRKFLKKISMKPSTIGFGEVTSGALFIWYGLVTGVQYRQVIRFWVGRTDRMLMKYGGRGGGIQLTGPYQVDGWSSPMRRIWYRVWTTWILWPLSAGNQSVPDTEWYLSKRSTQNLQSYAERKRCLIALKGSCGVFCLSCGGSWIAQNGAEIQFWKKEEWFRLATISTRLWMK